VTSGLDEEHDSVDAVIHNVHAVDLVLCVQVCIESLLDVLDNWIPRFIIVNEVTETRGVDDRQPQTDTVLLDVRADRLNVDSFGQFETGALALLRRVQGSVEEGVHEGRFAESRLA
jgi:hypothetical protein